MPVEPYESFSVPVRGGELHVGRWGDSGTPVVGLHGITGNHRSWAPVARALGEDVTLVVPDLRGRGRSNGLPGPCGARAHTEDLLAVLDHLDVDRAVLAGHSLGAFLAAFAASHHPDRWSAVVLVDGGVPIPLPQGIDPDAVLDGVLGPALKRLSMEFESPEAYLELWRAHPAFVDDAIWSDDVRDGLLYDLEGEPPHLRSSARVEAVRADGGELLTDDEVRYAHRGLTQPTVLLRAPRGLRDEVPGLYPAELIDPLRSSWAVTIEAMVGGTNHYSILFGPVGAKTVATHIGGTVARARRRRG
jgi:lipase